MINNTNNNVLKLKINLKSLMKKIMNKMNNNIKKKGVRPPAIKTTEKNKLKKIINNNELSLIFILEQKNKNKVIGNNFNKNEPNINSEPKILETVARIISNPNKFFPVKNCK